MPNSDAQETSVQGGAPVELYEFSVGASEVYRFTSSEGEYVLNALTYSPLVITRTSIEKSDEAAQEDIEIELPSNNAVPRLFIGIQPPERVDVTVLRVHETASPQTTITLFDGYVKSVSINDYNGILKCTPFNEVFRRAIPRFTYQGLCNHSLYDAGCKINRFLFDTTGTVTAISTDERTLTIPGVGAVGSNSPADAFVGGYIEFGTDTRMIVGQSGDNVTMFLPFRESPLNETVTLFQGCAHDLQTCIDKFDNAANYGGFPYIPSSNLFSLSQFMKSGGVS